MVNNAPALTFPFLFGGTFIEGRYFQPRHEGGSYFPSFSEGLSLRATTYYYSLTHFFHFPSFSEGLSLRVKVSCCISAPPFVFPFLFGGTFIEGIAIFTPQVLSVLAFPFLFGGTFIEGG